MLNVLSDMDGDSYLVSKYEARTIIVSKLQSNYSVTAHALYNHRGRKC